MEERISNAPPATFCALRAILKGPPGLTRSGALSLPDDSACLPGFPRLPQLRGKQAPEGHFAQRRADIARLGRECSPDPYMTAE